MKNGGSIKVMSSVEATLLGAPVFHSDRATRGAGTGAHGSKKGDKSKRTETRNEERRARRGDWED